MSGVRHTEHIYVTCIMFSISLCSIPDLRTVDSIFSLDLGTGSLVHTSTDRHGVTTVVTRSVEEDLMQVVMEVNGVTAKATFKRKN